MKKYAIFILILLSASLILAQENDLPLSQNGITVGSPKVYDTYYLQQQLQSLKAQLQQLQVLNSTTLTGHIGNVQSANLQQLGFSLQGGGPSTPAITTTTGTNPSVVSAAGALTSPNPTVGSSSLTMPAAGQSSLDTLNESMQLAYEITNLELALDGALNDKLDIHGKPRRVVTIGFPITFAPPDKGDAKKRENSVAEIHVTLCGTQNDVSIMTVLPQERTYNVAGLVDHSVAASLGGVIGGIFSVGGGFLWHHQRYDLVQQQETVALRTQSGYCDNRSAPTASFVWQVYPVLGNKYVRPGMQQNFVQFSIPGDIAPKSGSEIIRACVQASWRNTSKNGSILSPPASTTPTCYSVPYFDTTPKIESVSVNNIGSNQLWITAHGTFLPGTAVRIGSTTLPQSSVVISGDNNTLEFTAAAPDLVAAGGARLISREGDETPLSNLGGQPSAMPLIIDDITVSPYSDTLDRLNLKYTPPSGPGLPLEPCSPMPGVIGQNTCIPADPWIVTIGDKTYGLADAPFFENRELHNDKNEREISLLIPSASLTASTRITMQRLLWSNHFYYGQGFLRVNTVTVAKATIASTSPGLHLILVGSNLGSAMLEYPSNCGGCLKAIQGRLAHLDIPADTAKDLKQIILCMKTDSNTCDPNLPPVIVDIPSASTGSAASKPAKPSLKSNSTVKVGAATASIDGSGLDQVTSILYATIVVPSRLSTADPPQLLLDLPAAISGRPGKYSLLVKFADKTTTSYLLTVQEK